LATYLLAVGLGYLLGSLPSGLWIGRLGGVADVRRTGSGSSGATNVTRARGPGAGALVLAIDLAKGWVAAAWLPVLVEPAPGDALALSAGMAAVVGHVWPVLAHFRGGKGAATAGGVVLAVCPAAFAVCVGLFALVVVLTRVASLGSLAATFGLPPVLWLLQTRFDTTVPASLYLFSFALAALIVWTHRRNIGDLLAGRERKVGRAGKGAGGKKSGLV
jgi:glycerol-3-phosphate acyltransferase PlsY